MNKNIIKSLSLIIILPLLFSLCACARGGGGAVTTGGYTGAVTEASVSALKIVDGGKSDFRVIYPEEPGAELYAQVMALIEAVKKATGVTLEAKSDFLGWNDTRDSGAYEILIGETNYEESAAVLSELRTGDYAIRAAGHKIVITGHSTDAVKQAVGYFSKNLIDKNLITSENGKISLLLEEYTYMSTPPVASLQIDGTELKNFKLVYASSEPGYDTEAAYLCDLIAERYGYVLGVVSDKNTEATQNEILIGPTNRTESSDFALKNPTDLLGFTMGVQNGKFVINAHPYSCRMAAQRFSSKYLYSGESSVSIGAGETFSDSYLSKANVPLTSGADIRVMTANILAEFESWGGTTPVAERAEIFAAVLKVYSPDVVGVQEVTDQWYKILPAYIDDTYSFLFTKTQDGLTNYSSILYKKDKYNVIDSGVKYFSTEGKSNIRLVTWAVFEDKTTNDRFILFNTHWCWDTFEHAHTQATEEAALIKLVTEKYNYTYFCTADYNTIQLTENYNYFLGLTGAVDAKYTANDAGVLLNISGGCGSLGSPRGESGNSIDHIFMSPTVGICAFETVVINQTWDLSDHSPKYCDVKLK